jgi:hypothetical protein
LRTSSYKYGSPIDKVTDNAEWSNMYASSFGAYCWYNNDSASNELLHGKLYNYFAIQYNEICPDGWTVISDDDFVERNILLSETSGEKFSNITYYLNGNNEEKFENELDEMVIYDSDIDFEKYLEKITKKITNKVIKNINDDNFDVYFINFSVLDLASDFLENQEQKEKIIKILDKQLVKLADYTLAKDGTLFISSSYV